MVLALVRNLEEFHVKTVLVIAYLMSGHVIDTETLDAANMEDCKVTRLRALAQNTPITTRYGSDVKISAECKESSSLASSQKPAL